jgi:Protein of unknown function (DUF1236)
MRNQRTTFLAGIAALALIAGTGFAAAQDTATKDKQGAMPPRAATQPTQTEKGSSAKIGQKAQPGTATSANAKEPNRHAQDINRGDKADKEKLGESKANKGRMDENRAAQGEQTKTAAPTTAEQGRQGGPNTAQSQDQRLRGRQGSAAGVSLNDEQRTRIRDTVINTHGAPRVGSVDFGVNVGTVIPRGRVQIVPVPETLVRIEPSWRGFRYFIYEDELVIVDPHDMTIVAVVPV